MVCKKKAMTLIELIITLAILGIMIGVISNFFISNYIQLNSAEDKVYIQVDIHRSLSDISTNILESTGFRVVGEKESVEYDDFYEVDEFIIEFKNDDSE